MWSKTSFRKSCSLCRKKSNPVCRSSRSGLFPQSFTPQTPGTTFITLLLFFSMCRRTRTVRTQWGVPWCTAPPSARPRARRCTVMTFPRRTGSSSWFWSPALEHMLRSREERLQETFSSLEFFCSSLDKLMFLVRQCAGRERSPEASRSCWRDHSQWCSGEESPPHVWLRAGAAGGEPGEEKLWVTSTNPSILHPTIHPSTYSSWYGNLSYGKYELCRFSIWLIHDWFDFLSIKFLIN